MEIIVSRQSLDLLNLRKWENSAPFNFSFNVFVGKFMKICCIRGHCDRKMIEGEFFSMLGC